MPKAAEREEVLQQFSMKLPPSMLRKIEEIARYEDRTTAAQIRRFLAESVREYFDEQRHPPRESKRN